MAKQDPSSQDKGHMPPWFVNDLGAKGFHYEKIEDYDVPPEESFGSLFMPDRVKKGYHVEEIKDGVYWLTSGWYDCMFLTTGNGVIAVDAPTALGEKILDAIEDVTDEPVTHVVYSHWHADHIGAAAVYGPDVEIHAHEKTHELLTRFPDPNRPLPTHTFAKDKTLEVNGVKLELSYQGQNHSEGNIFIYAPQQKVLAAIDILAPGWIAFKECDHSENLSGWVQAHDQILEYDFDYIVCGHVSRYGTRDDVLTSQEYAHDLVRFSREALETVPMGHFLAKVDSGSHKGAFRAAEEQYFTAVTNYATKKMLERETSNGQHWSQRLNGADVMTKDNCFAMAEKIRLEQHHNGYMGHDGPPDKFFM